MTTTHFPARRSAAAVAATRTRTALDDLGDAAQSFIATLRVWRRRLRERDELSRMDDRLLKTIAAYADAYDTGPVPNETARQLIDQYLAIEQDEAKMNRSYVPRLAEALPGAKVARYIQVETKIRAVVRYDLAAGIPLVQ